MGIKACKKRYSQNFCRTKETSPSAFMALPSLPSYFLETLRSNFTCVISPAQLLYSPVYRLYFLAEIWSGKAHLECYHHDHHIFADPKTHKQTNYYKFRPIVLYEIFLYPFPIAILLKPY